jgi:DNA primase
LEQEAGAAGVEGAAGVNGPDAACAASIDPLADMEQRIEALFAELNGDALRFQQLYYAERRYLEDLDKRRRTGYEEVMGPLPGQANSGSLLG